MDDALEIANKIMSQPWPYGAGWYVYKNKLELYLRHQRVLEPDGSHQYYLCIANISMKKEQDKGKGIFTDFLDAVEPHYHVMIENVINDRLHKYFKTRGYTPIFYDWIESPVSYKLRCLQPEQFDII